MMKLMSKDIMLKKIVVFLMLLMTNGYCYNYDISVCCIFQNEARFLEEWIEHHKNIGIEHFYMIDNASTDNSYEILEPYIKKGIVEYFHIPIVCNDHVSWNNLQCKSYEIMINYAKNQTKWLAFIDSDEFIVLVKDKRIKSFLRQYEDYAGVCINWVFFGTSNIWEVPYGKMTKTLLYRAPLNFKDHAQIKTIVKPEEVLSCKNPHYFIFKDFKYAVNSDKEICDGCLSNICMDKIRLHHYWCRDKKFMIEEKILRRQKWYGLDTNIILYESQMNIEYDDILK